MAATKQQIEQGKARAGGNNPVKVTKAGVKRLGQAALIAASFTPIGRTAKIAGIIAKPISKVIQAKGVKNTKVVVEKIAKMQEKTRAERIASNSVKLKPAAKQIPNNPSYTKAVAQGRASGGTARPDYEVAKIPVSKNLTARVPAKSNYEFAKDMSRFGKIQKQNAGPLQATKAEAKANARGLKAANKPVSKNNRNRFGDGEMPAYLKSIR